MTGPSPTILSLSKDLHAHFEWIFGDNGKREGIIPDAMPNLVLCKLFRKADGQLDRHRCIERLTPWNKEFSSTLVQLFGEADAAARAARSSDSA